MFEHSEKLVRLGRGGQLCIGRTSRGGKGKGPIELIEGE